jgi:colanic acid biosynthesis glycosyl transferase WcaI
LGGKTVKIVFYTNSFYPDPIGIAYYNAEWVEHLLQLGHEVHVITAVPYYPQWSVRAEYQGRWRVRENYKQATVTRTWVYVPPRQTAFGRFLCEFSFMLASLPILFQSRPDVLIAVSPPFGAGLAAAMVRHVKKSPLWLHIQDLQVDAGQAVGFLRGRLLVSALTALERWVLRRADMVSTISAAMRERVMAKGLAPEHIALFPNWVDTEVMRPMPKETSFRREQGLTGKFVILYSGNIGIHQGLDSLVSAAEQLRENKRIVFLLIGEGNYREALAEKLKAKNLDNVKLLPLQSKERLPEVLSSADAGVVMETRRMANLSMPSKILNQMACGRPLIAVTSPQTALGLLIAEKKCGVVVPPGNIDLLALAALNLSGSFTMAPSMGANAREYVEKEVDRRPLLSIVPDLLDRTRGSDADAFRDYALKRFLDIVLALAGFVVSSPLWVLIPLAIWIEDRGPVLYRQERIGRFGRPFQAYKFRSMVKMELPEFDRRQASRGDPRVTRVGSLCRKTAMDEIPQLWNILKGDMSFVGPRALLPKEIEVHSSALGEIPLDRIPGYARRVRMKPGLTGIAQVYAARDVSRRHKFRWDLLYPKRQSLWLDIRLILASGWNSLTGRWEKIGCNKVERDIEGTVPSARSLE